jgi:hypothetical protein
MKKTRIVMMLMLFTFINKFAFSQQATWKEMEDFHAVMSVTFHPAEDNNLQPVKEKAGDLLRKAMDWQQAAVPQGYHGEATKPILKKLVKQCKALKAAVEKKKPDAELKKMITEAHEVFHEIKEKCVEK